MDRSVHVYNERTKRWDFKCYEMRLKFVLQFAQLLDTLDCFYTSALSQLGLNYVWNSDWKNFTEIKLHWMKIISDSIFSCLLINTQCFGGWLWSRRQVEYRSGTKVSLRDRELVPGTLRAVNKKRDGRESQMYASPEYSWFQTFAMFLMLYAFFWVILRRLNFICRRFGTLCLFHLHRQVGVKND